MAKGPYNSTDWPAGCDPYWSDLNGGCSDYAGDLINPKTGVSVNSLDLTNLIRGFQDALSRKKAPTANGATPPPGDTTQPLKKIDPLKDPAGWLKQGNNSMYVVVIFAILLLLMASAKAK